MLTKEEFRKQIVAKTLLKLNIPLNNLHLKINLKNYYHKDHTIILSQHSSHKYIIDCLSPEEFKIFTKTHFYSWWVLREGEFSTISPLSNLLHNNTLEARGI